MLISHAAGIETETIQSKKQHRHFSDEDLLERLIAEKDKMEIETKVFALLKTWANVHYLSNPK